MTVVKPTADELALLGLIGEDGAYGSDIADDDKTVDLLAACCQMCWVVSEPVRFDDFFSLTPAGLEVLNAAARCSP